MSHAAEEYGTEEDLVVAARETRKFRARVAALEEVDALIQALRTLRQRLGLTQERLAEEMVVSGPEIARLERKTIDPKMSTLIRYAHALGYRLSITLERIEPTPPPALPPPPRTVAAQVYVCPHCGKRFDNSNAIGGHVGKVHGSKARWDR